MRTAVVTGLVGVLLAAVPSCTSDDTLPPSISEEGGSAASSDADASVDEKPSEPIYYGWDASVPGREGNSCRDLLPNCGPSEDEDCCTSLFVPGGTFYRSYDGVTYTDTSWPATVSDFRLDKYEVTANRYHEFRQAWEARWRPPPGSGKHVHLNDGQGLYNVATSDFESGWEPAWAEFVVPAYTSTTSTEPVDVLNWYEAYAFCIWDGGFLPSEAEWNYAAAGGAEQRVYPWSVPPESDMPRPLPVALCLPVPGRSCCRPSPVGSHPDGNGRWGHADLIANAAELTLDSFVEIADASALEGYPMPCSDCTLLRDDGGHRAVRGGSCFLYVITSRRLSSEAAEPDNGMRCARPPVGPDGGQ